MAKVKYRFNAHTLSYDKIVISFKTKFKRFIALFSTTLVSSVLIAIGILQFYESPRMRSLHKENERLETQYKLLYKDLGTVEKVLDEIENRDNKAGSISLALLLADGTSAQKHTLYLGHQPIVSTEPASIVAP